MDFTRSYERKIEAWKRENRKKRTQELYKRIEIRQSLLRGAIQGSLTAIVLDFVMLIFFSL